MMVDAQTVTTDRPGSVREPHSGRLFCHREASERLQAAMDADTKTVPRPPGFRWFLQGFPRP